MGWLDWLFGGGKSKRDGNPAAPAARRVQQAEPPYFAIIDVETTGLSPKVDRVIELAVVRVDRHGRVIDEWATRFNPEGPVGATHIHGITDADVARAPLFRDVASIIAPHIAGLPIAAHNARFDLAFLRAEFRRAGWDVPWMPAYCTLDGSHHYMPHLNRRRLIDCCWDAGIRLDNAHSALGDARATAALLSYYLQRPAGTQPDRTLETVPIEARTITWPPGPSHAPLDVLANPSQPRRPRPPRFTSTRPQQPALIAQLTKLSLLEVLDEGAPVGALTYVETLLDALEDGVITDEEAEALHDLIEVYELDQATLEQAHRAFLLALAHRALDDGHVSRDERQQLEAIAKALTLPDALVPALIGEADAARAARLSADLKPLPPTWTLGEPLRVGDKVAFTGCDDRERERLESRAQQLGVRVMNNVSRLTAMLVTDGGFAGTKLASAQESNTRLVTPTDFATLLKHLQPSAQTPAKSPRAAPTSTATVAPTAAATTTFTATSSPSEIRAWGAANGYVVGVRGRLSAELVQAYELAMRG
jgi:DNA polymerase-3 subunit epsilon